jgi:hypothetical protein
MESFNAIKEESCHHPRRTPDHERDEPAVPQLRMPACMCTALRYLAWRLALPDDKTIVMKQRYHQLTPSAG